MAIWYTDNITGNDTTGNGTAATPYKTINKAVSVAASDDTIRVAGSGWTAITGTITGSISSTSAQTSVNMTSQLTAGVSLISIKDPQFGNRKLIYKVTAVTATSFTVHTPMGLIPGTIYEIEKITTNHYATAVASTVFETLNATGTTLTGIKIEGGWTTGFTVQDGITVMTYTIAAVTVSGNAFLMAAGQTGWSFNNFAFTALTGAINSPVNIGLGSIWGVNCRIFGANNASTAFNIPGTLMKLYITVINATALGGTGVNIYVPFTINELYVLDSATTSYAISMNNRSSCTIENMYVKNISISTTGNAAGGQLYAGDYTVNNLTIGWASDTSNQNYTLFGENSAGKLIANTNLGNNANKFFVLALPSGSQAQWINTAINVDDNTYLGPNLFSTGVRAALQSNFVKDIEGEKLLIAGVLPVFADPTVFDTGTNSLRIKRARVHMAVPIKQHFIPVGATGPITFTIRAKSIGLNGLFFAFQPTPGSPQAVTSSVPYILQQSFLLTSDWANFTYVLAAENVAQMAGNYVFFSCVSQDNWTQPYVWIDSVTIT